MDYWGLRMRFSAEKNKSLLKLQKVKNHTAIVAFNDAISREQYMDKNKAPTRRGLHFNTLRYYLVDRVRNNWNHFENVLINWQEVLESAFPTPKIHVRH